MPKQPLTGPITLPAASFEFLPLKNALEVAQIASDDTVRYAQIQAAIGKSIVVPGGIAPAPAPSLRLSSALVKTEGNTGTTTFTWTLTLDRDGSSAAYPYDWSIVPISDTPADAADFGGLFPSGSGQFGSSETSKPIPILVTGDTSFEPDDKFQLIVTAPGLNTVTSTGTISNDDSAPVPTIAFGVSSVSVAEGNSGTTIVPNVINIARNGFVGPLTINLSYGGTAISGVDYVAGPVSATAGADVNSIAFDLAINGETVLELDETITITATLEAFQAVTASKTITILNDDVAPPTTRHFADDVPSAAWYGGTIGWGPERDISVGNATSGKTLVVHEAWDPQLNRVARAQTFDPATGLFSAGVNVFTVQIAASKHDDHGAPDQALCYVNGRGYMAGGVHSGESMQVSVSGAFDWSTWSALAPLAPATYGYDAIAYPHLKWIGPVARMYARFEKTGSKMVFGFIKGVLAADGIAITWETTVTVLLDFEDQSRVYAVNPLEVPGTRVGNDAVFRIACTYATYGDTYRQDTFVFDHDTAAATIKAITGSYSRPTATAMTLGVARSNIRVSAQFEGNLYGNVPTHSFDTTQNPPTYQVAWSEGAAANNTAVGSFPIYERVLVNGVLSPAVTIGVNCKQRYDTFEYIQQSDRLEFHYITMSEYGFQRGGDLWAQSRVGPNGAWGGAAMYAKCSKFAAYDRIIGVKNGNDSLRVMYAEAGSGQDGGTSSRDYANLRCYARSATGPLLQPFNPIAQTQALNARLTTPLTLSQMKIYDGLFRAVLNTGVAMDALYMPVALDQSNPQVCLLNLLQDKYNLTVLGNVSLVKVGSLTGYAMMSDNVVGSYLKAADLVPSTASGLKFTQNNCGVGAFPLLEKQEATQIVGFDSGTTVGTTFIVPRTTSNQVQFRIGDGAGNTTSAANAIAKQMMVERRTGATSKNIYVGGNGDAALATGTQASTALATTAFAMLGTSVAASAQQIGGAFVGAAPGVLQMAPLESAFRRFLIETQVL